MSYPAVFLHPSLAEDAAPAFPTFRGTSQLVGTSPGGRTTVFVDPTLGQPGLQNAQDLINDADRVTAANDALFQAIGGPLNVIVFALGGRTDGTGGADHATCNFITGNNIEVCASFGSGARVSGLFEAELSECSMGGNLCFTSSGEALSRWCAAAVSNNALPDYASGPTWSQAGMPDFVNTTDPTDRSLVSIGCGMVFLSWLQGQPADTGLTQSFGLPQIAPAMVALGDQATLADLYANLTGDLAANAFSKFINAVNALPNGVGDDDPFVSLIPI